MFVEIVDLDNVFSKGRVVEISIISYVDDYGFFYLNDGLYYTRGKKYAWKVDEYLSNKNMLLVGEDSIRELKMKLREYKINRILCS